jgi:hypothetical protein
MKKNLLILCSIASLNVFAQNIKLDIGKKITNKNSTIIDMDMGMGGQMKISNNTTSVIEITGEDDNIYKATNTVIKIVSNNEMMGQETNFDSDKKEDIESTTGKEMSKKLNVPVKLSVDKNTGRASELEKNTKVEDNPSVEVENPFASIMGGGDKAAENNTSEAFYIIPSNKKVGDKWSEEAELQGLKGVKKYEYTSLKDGIATLVLQTKGKGTISKEMKGMQFELEIETTGNATLIIDTKIGLVKKNTSNIEVTGNMNAMGQAIPITIKTSTLLENE